MVQAFMHLSEQPVSNRAWGAAPCPASTQPWHEVRANGRVPLAACHVTCTPTNVTTCSTHAHASTQSHLRHDPVIATLRRGRPRRHASGEPSSSKVGRSTRC